MNSSSQTQEPTSRTRLAEKAIQFKQALWTWLPVIVFLIAVVMAIVGTFDYNLNRSNALWLSAGWVLAALAVMATLVWANQVGVEEAEENRTVRRNLQVAATVQANVAENLAQSVTAAQAEVDDAAKGKNQELLSYRQNVLAKAIVDAQSAATQAVNFSVRAMNVPTLFTQNSIPATLVATMITFIFSGLVVVTFWTAVSAKGWAAAIVWCGAFLVVGGAAGFLFGIPRSGHQKSSTPPPTNSLQSATSDGQLGKTTTAASNVPTNVVQQQPSLSQIQGSPIEQMADWLTKAIVGVALVNLRQIRDQLNSFSVVIAQSISYSAQTNGTSVPTTPLDQTSTSFALGMIIYFTMVGFLCGYLLTQMFLMNYVNRKNAET